MISEQEETFSCFRPVEGDDRAICPIDTVDGKQYVAFGILVGQTINIRRTQMQSVDVSCRLTHHWSDLLPLLCHVATCALKHV